MRTGPLPNAVRRVTAAAVVSAVWLTGCASPVTRPSQPPSPAPVSAPAGPLVGVYEPGVPGSWSGLSEFAAVTGVTPHIALYFSGWAERFRLAFAQLAWSHGAYTFVKMQPDNVTLASIAAGVSDRYLRSYALAVKSFPHPVLVSFGHEMNGDWYPWGAGHAQPSEFVAAWRHVVQVFRDEGATNAIWVWTVNSTNVAAGSLRRWWPGGAWVNWVGVDGYYYRPADTFGSVFGQTIAQIRTFSSAPVLIAETAVGGNPARASQIGGLFAGAGAGHIVGVIWFDHGQHAGLYHQDWRLEGDAAAVSAFTVAARQYLATADGR